MGRLENTCININRACDYIPGASFIVNTVTLGQKLYMESAFPPLDVFFSHNYNNASNLFNAGVTCNFKLTNDVVIGRQQHVFKYLDYFSYIEEKGSARTMVAIMLPFTASLITQLAMPLFTPVTPAYVIRRLSASTFMRFSSVVCLGTAASDATSWFFARGRTRDDVLKALRTYETQFEALPLWMRSDKEMFQAANFGYLMKGLFGDGLIANFRYAGEPIRDNEKVALEACKAAGNFKFVSARLRNSKPFVSEVIKNRCNNEKSSDEAEKTKEIFRFMGPDLKEDKELAVALLEKGPHDFKTLGKNWQDNEEVALYAIKRHSENINFVSERLLNKKEFILAAIRVMDRGTLKTVLNLISANLANDEEVRRAIDLC